MYLFTQEIGENEQQKRQRMLLGTTTLALCVQ
jgi:hypothetical protein